MGRYAHLSRFGALDEDDRAMVENALRETGARAWADRSIGQTSGGERQLTGLARALAQGSDLLILDEPLSALDLAHETAVLKILRPWVNAAPNRAVILVIHDLSLAARYCDELILLEPSAAGGRIAVRGRPKKC